jgi:hypothetical protein
MAEITPVAIWRHALGSKEKAVRLGQYFWKADSKDLNSLQRVSQRLAENNLYPSQVVIQWAHVQSLKAPITFSFTDMRKPISYAQVADLVEKVRDEWEELKRSKRLRTSSTSRKSQGSPSGSSSAPGETKAVKNTPAVPPPFT